MLILIAESKTMAPCNGAVSREAYASHCPKLEVEADGIMDALKGKATDELAGAVKLSPAMIRKLQQMVYEFPNKALGEEAIRAFTGVVFKAFDYGSLSTQDKEHTCLRVRIISSLYGWLRPDDVVKPYRFDFTTPLAPAGKTFAAYWRNAVTDCLMAELQEHGFTEILNLLPGDAARCIDWKRVEAVAKVWKADFQEVQPGGNTRTPNAGRLKTLRGQLLRQMITENLTTSDQLLTLTSPTYMAADTPTPSPGIITYHTIAD